MNWQEFTAFLGLATTMSFSPGPNTTLSAALAANHGLRRTLPFVCSVAVGWSLLLLVCALGLGALVMAVPLLSWALKVAGVAYLLWLAFKISRSNTLNTLNSSSSSSSVNTSGPAPSTTPAPPVTFWQGVALQFVNIKAWMLALAIVAGWIAGRADASARLAVVLPIMLAYGFASNLTYALAGSLLKDWLSGPHGSGKRLRWFNRAMALMLAVTALWVLTL